MHISSFVPRIILALTITAVALPAEAGPVLSASFSEPTTRYAHGVLGDDVEWGALEMAGPGGETVLRLPEWRVFEDLTPRLADLDGDGDLEVIVVESDQALGAQLAIYDSSGKIAATPFIGQSNRWLSPVGAADLDGDGAIEIAYVDRPHLAKTLRIWRFGDNGLTEVAAHPDVTNHQIGWDFIAGGLRDCGQGPEMVLASGDWREVVALRLDAGAVLRKTLGPLESVADIDAALACR